ncbi:MAG: hypothetical protein ACLQA5_04885 [Solirubrobacteraceae bacterium]
MFQNDNHHFSYPVVVPLRGVTISGHSSAGSASFATPSRVRTLQTPSRFRLDAAPAQARAVLTSPQP